jgi:hypothetical protein
MQEILAEAEAEEVKKPSATFDRFRKNREKRK